MSDNRQTGELEGTTDRRAFAEALGISTRTLRRLELRGLIPRPMRIGKGIVRWRRRDVEAFLNSGMESGEL